MCVCVREKGERGEGKRETEREKVEGVGRENENEQTSQEPAELISGPESQGSNNNFE